MGLKKNPGYGPPEFMARRRKTMGTVTPLLPLETRTDEELVELWVKSRGNGSRAPFEVLYRRHRIAVRSRIASVLGARGARHIDDVFQEVWFGVVRLTEFQPGSFRAWILTVATHRALDSLRARARDLAPDNK